MRVKVFIPKRYSSAPCNGGSFKYINIYKLYSDRVELLIENRSTGKTIARIIMDKIDFKKVKAFHWSVSEKEVCPTTSATEPKSCSIGKLITSSEFRICGKQKNKSVWDLRKDKYTFSGNKYEKLDATAMKLIIYRRESRAYEVIFDKEDYPSVSLHIWRVEKDSKGSYSVIASRARKQLSLHCYLMELSGQKAGKRGFRGIEPVNFLFDYRKSNLFYKHALNTYRVIDSKTMELTINKTDGKVLVIFDREDFERMNGITWECRSRNRISSRRYGTLKKLLLDKEAENFRYIRERKDEQGRMDFTKQSLRKGMCNSIYEEIFS